MDGLVVLAHVHGEGGDARAKLLVAFIHRRHEERDQRALVQLDGVVAADLFAVDVRSIGRRVAQCQDALA